MRLKKITSFLIIIIFICLIAGVGAFIYDATHYYRINKDYTSLPLQFNAEDSSSVYQMSSAKIIVYGGFIKGLQKDKDKDESIVIRALSPLPSITVYSTNITKIKMLIENVNPDFYARSIIDAKLPMTRVKVNTLQMNVAVKAGETVRIKPKQPSSPNKKSKYIILGDNRDGYGTFGQIIQQVNGQIPVLVIDNGDLVFSGKPNQYRLFDKMVSKISATLCTTPGNHDIRGNGRNTYTMLYGPAYYSFDFGDSHFVFLDSSPGWAEKRAISEEQYAWLERDLAKVKGKRIFVITHIPPRDPRASVTSNKIPDYANKVESGDNWLEQKLNNYNENKEMDHGFQDPKEAARFENIMTRYHVNTVYLSHIHSYLEYYRGGVHYLITGGAGAELLSKNSYYHYIIADMVDINKVSVVELPSPANNYIARYTATVQLFASAMYEENPVAVILIIIGFILLVILILIKIYIRWKQTFNTLGRWFVDIAKYAVKRFIELFNKRGKS